MRYAASTAVWVAVSLVWGVAGTLIGPGIAMCVVSVICGTIGAALTCAQQIGKRKFRSLPTAVIAAVLALGLSQILVFSDRLAALEIVFLAVFVSVPAFLASFLAWLLVHKNVSQ